MNFQQLFSLAMKRHLPRLEEPYQRGPAINVAAGNHIIAGAVNLPNEWRWPRDRLPAQNDSVDLIHCYHFLEHLTGEDAISFLIECERALGPGGVLQYCVPFYRSAMQFETLDHKSFWTEETLPRLFDPEKNHWGTHKWQLRVHFQVIAAIKESNMAIIGQLVKGE